MTKVCNKCGIEKDITLFSKNKKCKGGYRTDCKECQKRYRLDNIDQHRESNNKWYDKNRRSPREKSNLTEKEVRKIWYEKNKDRINKERREKRKKRTEQQIIKERVMHTQYVRKRYQEDSVYKILNCLRSRVGLAIKNQSSEKAFKTTELLGCSIEECRQHLEDQFVEGMSWDNHGVWHIDHIKPCASFDLTNEDEQKQCFHYTNLQPLWAEENLRKSDKLLEV